MTVRDGRGDVEQTTTGYRGPLMVQSLTSAKSKFLSLGFSIVEVASITGHEDLKMLKRYTHLRAENLVERLG